MFENFTFGQEEFVIILLVVFVIGSVQGGLSMKSIISRFDRRRRKRIRNITIILAIIFILYAITNIGKFTGTADLPEIPTNIPTNLEELDKISENFTQDLGLWEIISLAIPVIVFLLGQLGRIRRKARIFLMILGVAGFSIMMFVTFVDYVPSQIVVNVYIVYQVGIVIGSVFVGLVYGRF